MESIVGFLKGIVATITLLVSSMFAQVDPQSALVGPIFATDPIVQEATTTEPVATTTTPAPTQPKPKTKEEIAYDLGKMIGALEQQVTELEKKVIKTPPPQPTPIPAPTPVPTAPAPQPQPEPLPITQPKPSMAEIKIFSPMSNKGLGRTYTAQPQIYDESNYIYLGLVVYNDDGSVNKDAVVTITATDESQNKTLNGTGNLGKILVNGEQKSVYYYGFQYEFRTAGKHTITFSANGMTASVDLEVGVPDPA